ncbi:MAG: RNA polymerase sigma factor [Actinocrinis sp.]
MLAATVRVAGDLEVAEECVQDAYLAALDAWTKQGVPDRPGAWLTTAARRRALDVYRRQQTLRNKLPLLIESYQEQQPAAATVDRSGTAIPDDRLRLIFTCCHPALSAEAQIALTLRLVCGLTTRQIAQAFLVSEQTMAARVTRAKKKIAAARIPYRIPELEELPDRLKAVLAVVHLVYTTAHTDPTGDQLTHRELADRAIDLARTLRTLMPDEREVRGLLALLLLTDARDNARTDAEGDLVLLEDQDRALWDQAMIDEGKTLAAESLRGTRDHPARYGLQAAIAALHAEARTYQDTDWRQIIGLYDVLLRVWPSPVVALNRAVARAMCDGPAAGLADIEALERTAAATGTGITDRGREHDGDRANIAARDNTLSTYRYLPAAKADLLRRLGRRAEAVRAYRDALALTEGTVERRFIERRLAQLSAFES